MTTTAAITSILGRGLEILRQRTRTAAAGNTQGEAQRLVAVLGNEGGDMDSTVGVLYTALAAARGSLTVKGLAGDPNVSYVPVLNYAIDDLALRGDVFTVMKKAEIDVPSVYASAVDEPGLLAACDHILLFDHNRLKASQREYEPKVISIIDHHADEGASPDAQRAIATCGSACSLLVQLCPQVADLPAAPLLLRAAVVLDTANFDPATKKTTEIDLAAMNTLTRHADAATLADANREFFSELNTAKTSVSHLTIAQNLRRDYKASAYHTADDVAVQIGIAAWLEPVEDVVARHGATTLLREMRAFAHDKRINPKGLDIIAVMFHFERDGENRRQLLWLAVTGNNESGDDAASSGDDKSRAAARVGRFLFAEAPGLCGESGPRFVEDPALVDRFADASCEGVPRDHHGCVAQGDAACSRKSLMPALVKELKQARL